MASQLSCCFRVYYSNSTFVIMLFLRMKGNFTAATNCWRHVRANPHHLGSRISNLGSQILNLKSVVLVSSLTIGDVWTPWFWVNPKLSHEGSVRRWVTYVSKLSFLSLCSSVFDVSPQWTQNDHAGHTLSVGQWLSCHTSHPHKQPLWAAGKAICGGLNPERIGAESHSGVAESTQ